MAGSTEEIISVYKAQVSDYTQKIDEIIKKVRTLTGIEEDNASKQVIANRSLVQSANQRKKLLDDEVANLKKLQAESKKAFTVPEIQKFNSDIATSKNNIAVLKGEAGSLGQITSGLKDQFFALGATLLAAFSARAVINFAKDSVAAFREAELSAKKLETAIVNIGEEGQDAFKRLLEQSKQLQNISIFSDEDIQKAQTQLSQFGLLSNQIDGIIPKILDLASAQGIDLGQATDIVIQGINGVTRGLKPLGLEFANTGNKAENFAIISEKLNKFQGQTAAVLDTSAGRAANLANQFDELKERIGGLIESSGILKNFTTAFQAFIDSFKTDEERIQDIANVSVKNFVVGLEAEATGILNSALKQKEAIEKLTDPEREKFLADKRLEILSDFASRIADNAKLIAEEQKKLDNIGVEPKSDANDKLIEQSKERIKAINEESQALQIVIDRRIQASKPPENKLGKTEEQKAKEAAEAQQRLNKALEEEKKLIADINKLSIETELDPAKKVQRQKEIDALLAKVQTEDKRSLAEVLKSIEEKSAQDSILINTKAFQEISKQQSQKSFAEDEKNLTDFVNTRKELLLKSNITAIQLDRELTAVDAFELNQRLQNAIDANTGVEKDTIESRKRIEKAQIDIDAFELKRIQAIAAERLKVEQHILEQTQRARQQQSVPGSIEDITTQQDILKENAQREIEIQEEVLLNFKSTEEEKALAATKIHDLILTLNNDLADKDAELTKRKQDNIAQFLDASLQAADMIANAFADVAIQNSENIIKSLQDQKDALSTSLDEEEERLQESRDKKLISEKDFEERSKKLKDQRIDSERKINEAIKAEQRKQAQIQKQIAIFEATLNLAKAISVAVSAAPPPFNAVLAAISAALAGIQLAAVIATPIPQFKLGTKGKATTGLGLVGEEGPELINIPARSQILPHKKTIQYKPVIDSMMDGTLDSFVHRQYIAPALQEAKERHSIELKRVENKNFAQNIANSFLLQNKVEGDFEYSMMRALEKNRKYDKAFADYQAKVLADHLNNTDFRKM